MDDLLGEDWQKPATGQQPTRPNAAPSPSPFASNYSSLQPSRTVSPAQNISRPSSAVNGGPKPPASGDSFGNLLGTKANNAGKNGLSMQERQRQLIEEKRRQQEQQAHMWENLGSGRGTPEIRQPSPALPTQADTEEDILAAFNKNAPVNKASYYPAPPSASGTVSGRSTPALAQPAPVAAGTFDDDDDPFGLSELGKKPNGHATAPVPASKQTSDDDILGDLSKPVAEKPATQPPVDAPSSTHQSDTNDSVPAEDGPLAELVEMGFPADTARIALAENGGNVQNAVGWLLQQAHEESRQKARGEAPAARRRSPKHDSRSPNREAEPAWMNRPSSGARHRDNASSTAASSVDKDSSQVAQEFGNKIFKSANSLWKASQKQMAKTLSEFQQPDAGNGVSDPSQPKWMRDASTESSRASSQRRQAEQVPPRSRPAPLDLTDEAAALDAPRERPQKPPRPQQATDLPSRGRSPVEPLPQRLSQQQQQQPKFMQQVPPQPDRRPATKLSRQEVEDQSAQAYISPARRKRTTPKPEPQMAPEPEPEVDLFSSAPSQSANLSSAKTSQTAPPRTATPPRPKALPRNVPSVSPSALATSAGHRKAGGEHFKRGDYAAAHEQYTAALNPLPPTHPVAVVVLTNRALTALKTGDAKTAVTDADKALEIIGSTMGVGETIELGAGEGSKDMKEFYGKAVMRKAEALEHLEKYTEAANAWRQAVAAGVGGAVSLRGRDRCEKAASPKPPASTAAKPAPRSSSAVPGKAPPAKSLGNSLHGRPSIPSASSTEAVRKLRAANAEAEKADDEKFALTDSVDAKLTAWRGGKSDNLRALLQSMDVVLWEGAGWKKVGMSDLVMPNKVKIVYMKAIGKVHPDKIPQDATTEQRMVSAAVFSTLNEAWDKFRKDNNL